MTTTPTAVLRHVDDVNQRIMLIGPRVAIGRGVNGPHDIALPAHDASGSRLHAVLSLEDGVWTIEDHSLNGTRVNGERLQHQRRVLDEGDYLQVGNTFAYVFHLLDMTELSAPVQLSPEDLPDFGAADATRAPAEGVFVSAEGAVFRDGSVLAHALTHLEHALLTALAAAPGRVLGFEQLARAVWAEPRPEGDVRELVQRLWHKLEPRPDLPRYVFIQPGAGVVLVPEGL
jgi:pSer/pThr/pTyr-binding forkhead associated (FHA) protein